MDACDALRESPGPGESWENWNVRIVTASGRAASAVVRKATGTEVLLDFLDSKRHKSTWFPIEKLEGMGPVLSEKQSHVREKCKLLKMIFPKMLGEREAQETDHSPRKRKLAKGSDEKKAKSKYTGKVGQVKIAENEGFGAVVDAMDVKKVKVENVKGVELSAFEKLREQVFKTTSEPSMSNCSNTLFAVQTMIAHANDRNGMQMPVAKDESKEKLLPQRFSAFVNRAIGGLAAAAKDAQGLCKYSFERAFVTSNRKRKGGRGSSLDFDSDLELKGMDSPKPRSRALNKRESGPVEEEITTAFTLAGPLGQIRSDLSDYLHILRQRLPDLWVPSSIFLLERVVRAPISCLAAALSSEPQEFEHIRCYIVACLECTCLALAHLVEFLYDDVCLMIKERRDSFWLSQLVIENERVTLAEVVQRFSNYSLQYYTMVQWINNFEFLADSIQIQTIVGQTRSCYQRLCKVMVMGFGQICASMYMSANASQTMESTVAAVCQPCISVELAESLGLPQSEVPEHAETRALLESKAVARRMEWTNITTKGAPLPEDALVKLFDHMKRSKSDDKENDPSNIVYLVETCAITYFVLDKAPQPAQAKRKALQPMNRSALTGEYQRTRRRKLDQVQLRLSPVEGNEKSYALFDGEAEFTIGRGKKNHLRFAGKERDAQVLSISRSHVTLVPNKKNRFSTCHFKVHSPNGITVDGKKFDKDEEGDLHVGDVINFCLVDGPRKFSYRLEEKSEVCTP